MPDGRSAVLATFVIGLREGLEASLIVGIIASFLSKQGRRDALRQVWLGVGVAVTICLAVGIGLKVASQNLPQRQQEGLETIVGAAAVVMVTYMVVWMRRHSRDLKRSLEGAAGSALATGSATALVAMAFLAVLREGLETAVFLLAAFDASSNAKDAVIGAALGIAVAVGLGYGIYRGGVRINLSKFFRVTGLVLVLVAAGLVVTALHTAHEAGWLTIGQGSTIDLSWLVRPGTVRSSLLTGMLGMQPTPVVIEVVGWLVYLIPVGAYVAWPPGKTICSRRTTLALGSLGLAATVAAIGCALAAPGLPAGSTAASSPVTVTDSGALASKALQSSSRGTLDGPNFSVDGRASSRDGVALQSVSESGRATEQAAQTPALPATLTGAELRRLGDGRIPIGIETADLRHAIPATYLHEFTTTWQLDPHTGAVVDVTGTESWIALAHTSSGVFPVGQALTRHTTTPPAVLATQLSSARHDRSLAARHQLLARTLPLVLAAVAFALLALALLSRRVTARRADLSVPSSPVASVASLVSHS
jgi:high-affinity iron transporter